ncbi:MAG: TatD family hydrolase [Fimbriimonadales bacterium]|nr:TatD family hydrolase [Fimbriimonadales bacterium]
MRLVDTHCHLNFGDAFPDVSLTLDRARANGVDRVIVIGCDTETSKIAVELSKEFDGVYAVVGWHPNYAANYSRSELGLIEAMLSHKKVVGIGEIGLDYHWDYATIEQQRACTSDHLQLAISAGVPVVFHCREAYSDLLDWIERLPIAPEKMVLHCFGGDAMHASRATELGIYFGVDGPVTYKKNDSLRLVLASVPSERLMLETDAPYLSPEPYRGKPNEPAMVSVINARLAEVLGISVSECAELTTSNAEQFFGV